jgi:Alginate lyase
MRCGDLSLLVYNALSLYDAFMKVALLIWIAAIAVAQPKFVHPGIFHNKGELDFLKAKVTAGEEPWKSAFEALRKDAVSQLSWTPNPIPDVKRGAYNRPDIGGSNLERSASAAYSHAIQWTLTGRREHAEKSIGILNAYASMLKTVGDHDARLLVGMVGINFLNAAELMRHTYDGWKQADQKQFEVMLRDVFYPVIKDFFPFANGNWDAAMIQTMLAMGVFLDDRAMFDRAVNQYFSKTSNGSIVNYFRESGECQESGRDQAHTQMGLGYLGAAAEIGWKQGVDLYGAMNNRLAAGFEYTAKYNLGNDVPYEPYTDLSGKYVNPTISSISRGRFSSIYERALHHYQDRAGLKMPFVKQVVEKIRPEPWMIQHASWGTLLFAGFPAFPKRYDPSAPQPDPLVMQSGKRVEDRATWRKRRTEILEMLTHEMYGAAPDRPGKMTFKVFDNEPNALGGIATRRQVAVFFNGNEKGPRMDILIYLPKQTKGPVKTILGLNFQGNHGIHKDPGIRISTSWMEPRARSVVNNRATEESRGATASRWPVELILKRGYAVATVYAGDISPDFKNGLKDGVHTLYPELQDRGDNFSTMAAWAWGLSRALDYLQTDRDIDGKNVAVFGFSRMGKAALWAGANDERFAAVISNESGAGGAKLFRRGVGENITRLNTVFPHWFCKNFRNYMDLDQGLPWDQHMLLALVAPRPLYIGSAALDREADPEGEFLAAKAATPVYRLLGTDGLPADVWPAVNRSAQGRIGYHVRAGAHDVTEFDWTQYLNFLDRQLQ